MKTTNKLLAVILMVGLSYGAFADSIKLSSGQEITGTIVQTNEGDVLVLTPNAAFEYSKSRVQEIEAEPRSASGVAGTNRLPGFETAILVLSRQPWATNLTPIPATVIDKGILRNVPYNSFHCGADYEVNVYGDVQNPAGVEIGVYHGLTSDDSAKSNCLNFISGLLADPADRGVLRGLKRTKDLQTRDGLTFEVTPPTDEDAYNGWWISVYSESQLDASRASDGEMQQIAMTQADIAKDVYQATNYGAWSADDLRLARHSFPKNITFKDASGTLISNATVVHVTDGVSLVWEKDGGSKVGFVKLEDLPDDLRTLFGYDEAKAKAADKLEQENKEEWQAQVAAAEEEARQARAANPQPDPTGTSYGDTGYGDVGYSDDRTVYVHGYYRSNGTYVNSYYRRPPSR